MGDGPGGGPSGTDADFAGINADIGLPGSSPDPLGSSKTAAKSILTTTIPVLGPVLGLTGILDGAVGDPNAGQGVSGPEGGGGVGGGPGNFPGPQAPITAPSAPAAPPTTPAVIPDTITNIKDADLKRKRIGRQETILTSRGALSEPSIYRPTLLGQ